MGSALAQQNFINESLRINSILSDSYVGVFTYRNANVRPHGASRSPSNTRSDSSGPDCNTLQQSFGQCLDLDNPSQYLECNGSFLAASSTEPPRT